MTGVLLSGLFAALVAIGTTVAIERWGGRAGGLIGTMPSTIVPASIGIASTGGTGDTLFLAMCAVAPGMLLSASFLYMWRVIPPRLPHTSLAPVADGGWVEPDGLGYRRRRGSGRIA